MSDWLKALNPTAPINGEAEAQRAARASAVSIFIGVIVGVIGVIWTVANPGEIQAAVDQVGGDDATKAAAAQLGAQMTIWIGAILAVIQLIFGVVQWRDAKAFIAILFLILLAYGVVSTLAAPMIADMSGVSVAVPMWQIALSLVIMAVQTVLHVAGLRGIKALDRIQTEAAR